MHKRVIFFVGLFLTFGLGVSNLEISARTKQPTQQNSAVWEIQRNGELEGYLVGSIHVMKPTAYPLAPAFTQSLTQADLVVFETKLDEVLVQSESLFELGLYQDGTTLQQTLPPKTYNQLQTLAENLGIPMGALNQMEPWLATQAITMRLLQQAGYRPIYGVDFYFFQKTQEANLPYIGLETPLEQFQFFDDLSTEEQIAFLRHSIEKTQRNIEQVDRTVALWKKGDMRGLEAILLTPMEKEFPEMYQALIVERNQNWMLEILALLREDEVPFIVLGTAHLVGDRGLVKLMQARGYTLQQL